jgi:hypothetical protein
MEVNNLLLDWIEEIEFTEKINGIYRCWTDQAHGFYFDVNPNTMEATTMDGTKLADPDNQLGLLIANFKHE